MEAAFVPPFSLEHAVNPEPVKLARCQTDRAPTFASRSQALPKTTVQTPAPSINVTPLIDVLLVLLIIFMVIQPQKEMKLPVKAPGPAPESAPPAPHILMLAVSADARLRLNSQPVPTGELSPTLAKLMQERSADDRALFIKAPDHFPYQFMIDLIDTAKKSGVITVGLLKDEPGKAVMAR
jgi:biopolymer transport protein ExbD